MENLSQIFDKAIKRFTELLKTEFMITKEMTKEEKARYRRFALAKAASENRISTHGLGKEMARRKSVLKAPKKDDVNEYGLKDISPKVRKQMQDAWWNK